MRRQSKSPKQIDVRNYYHYLSLLLLLLLLFGLRSGAAHDSKYEATSRNSGPKESDPSQLFLPAQYPAGRSIVLVNGFNQRVKTEDDEAGGFIMRAPITPPPTTMTNTDKIDIQEDQLQTTTMSPQQQTTSVLGRPLDSERIPIDANRQQFLTHDQLSLSNNNNTNNNNYNQQATEMNDHNNNNEQFQRAVPARSSTILHVPSLLSG